MRPEDILVPTPSGLCCKPGGFHIDPTHPVEKALITHGHSDHARAGHGAVLATQETLDIMRLRYGENFAGTTQAIRYGETLSLDGTAVERGRGANTLGHPVLALAALVELLAAQRNPPLEPGEIITTGTLTAPRDIAAGQRWGFRLAGIELAPLEAVFA